MSAKAVKNVERFIYIVFPIALMIGSGDIRATTLKSTVGHCARTSFQQTAQNPPMTATIYFDTEQHSLNPAFEQTLQQHIRFLKANRHKILIIHGHADENGSEAYNMELSQQRANQVKQFFLRHGIPVTQLYTYAHGEHQPAKPKREQKLNRRVDITYDNAMLLSAW